MPRSSDIKLSTRGTALRDLRRTVLQTHHLLPLKKSSSSFCSVPTLLGNFWSCYRAGTTRGVTDTSQALLSLREGGFTTQQLTSTIASPEMIRKIWKLMKNVSLNIKINLKKQPEMTLNCCCRLVSTIHSESPLSAAEGVNFSSKSGTSSTMMHMMHNYAARLVGTTFSPQLGRVLNSTHPAEIFLKRKLVVNIHQTPKTHACLTSLRLSLVLWSLTFFTFLKGKRAGVRRVSVNVAITT